MDDIAGPADPLEVLLRHPPFDAMAKPHLEWLVERAQPRRFAPDEVILDPSAGEADSFYVILSGSVVTGHAAALAQEGDEDWQLDEGDCFPLGALLARRPVASPYRAGEAAACLALPAADFRELMNSSAALRDHCTRRLATLLERSKQVVQTQYSRHSSDGGTLASPLSALVRREPISCLPDTSIQSVLETMDRLGVGSMIVTDGEKRPVGVFTLQDVLDRVALARPPLESPIASVMTVSDLAMLSPAATGYDAALLMARRGIRHVLVADGERLAGIVSERDLFAVQRVSLRQLSAGIAAAEDLAALRQYARDIRRLAQNMLSQGVAAEQLTQLIATLNDKLSYRLVSLETGRNGIAGIDFCWIALGSEGRYEQTFATDQDNGIVFACPEGVQPAAVRERLLPFAQRVNDGLAECGFPLCKGNIMAGNPMWCLSLDEWQARFASWIDSGTPEALLNASIFFDFRALWGDESLARSLRAWLTGRARANPRFLHQMTANALMNRPPLGMLRGFSVERSGEHANTIDLKMNGSAIFVDAARIYGLAAGVEHTGTAQRLREIGPHLHIPPAEAEAWVEAFLFIQLLRLRAQDEESRQGRGMGNRINPYALHELDQQILKEAFRQARKLQSRLALDYRL